MALIKLLYSSDNPEACGGGGRLVEDFGSFRKTAEARHSGINFSDPAVQPDADHQLIHVIALGATERYGLNRNGDGFKRAACINYHPTFVSNGAFYQHHVAEPGKDMGKVAASCFSPSMDRVELAIHAHTKKAASWLEKYAADGEFPVSMGCKVAFDVCTICGTRRANSRDPNQCECVRTKLGKILDDGQHVGTDNPEPFFYDISGVGRPADRIAWSLSKAASDGSHLISSVEAAEAAGMVAPAGLDITAASCPYKTAALRLLADATTRYRAAAANDPYLVLRKSASREQVLSDDTITELRKFAHSDVFNALAHRGIVLDLVSFAKLAFGTDSAELKVLDEAKAAVGAFDYAANSRKIAADGFYDVDLRYLPYAAVAQPLRDAAATADPDQLSYKVACAVADGWEPALRADKAEVGLLAANIAVRYGAYKTACIGSRLSMDNNELAAARLAAIVAATDLFH